MLVGMLGSDWRNKAVLGHQMAKKGAVLLTAISIEVLVGWISFGS